MMQFATCDPKMAKQFINSALECEVDFTKLPVLMDLVQRDILRVQDPMMHGGANITGGKKYDTKHQPEIDKAVAELTALLKENE